MKKILFIILLGITVQVEAQSSTFSVANNLFEKGRYKQAIKTLQSIQPQTYATYVKTASIYETIDANKQALQFYKKAIALDATLFVKKALAKNYIRLKKYDSAISIYEEIIKKDSKNLIITYKLGKLYRRSQKYRKALETFLFLASADTENANYQYQLGQVYAIIKERNLAMNSFLKTLTIDDKHVGSMYRLALSYKALKDKDSFALYLNRGLQVEENHVSLNRLKINDLYKKKKYLTAISLLLKIDSIEPVTHYTNKMLGKSYFKIDSLKKAEKYFKLAYDIDKTDFKAVEYLGDIAYKQKRYNKSYFTYLRASTIDKKSRDKAYYGIGLVHLLGLKKDKLALHYFKEAKRENYKNYRAAYQIAKLEDKLFKDKTIAYKSYGYYLQRFVKKDKLITDFAQTRMREIKNKLFKEGVLLK